MKEMLYEVRCLKSNEDMMLSSFDCKHRTSYNISFKCECPLPCARQTKNPDFWPS